MKKILFISIITFASLLFFYLFFYANFLKTTPSPKMTLLHEKGNFCLNASEKAVANREAIVEFQKYEILGAKALIMRTCMEDNGFEENPLWLNKNIEVIKAKVKDPSISEDVVMEDLKREAMYIFNNLDDQPLYWRSKEIK